MSPKGAGTNRIGDLSLKSGGLSQLRIPFGLDDIHYGWSSNPKRSRCFSPGVIPEIDIWRVAVRMVNRYADYATVNSLRRVAELTVEGDHAGAAIWRRITLAIEQLTDTTAPLN